MKNLFKNILHKLSILEGVRIKVLFFSAKYSVDEITNISISYRNLRTDEIVEYNNILLYNLNEILQNNYDDIILEKSLFYKIPFSKRLDKLTNIVCSFYKMSEADVYMITRKREIVRVRHLIQHFCYLFKGPEGLEQIGFNTGKKNHATVIHAYKTICNMRDTDKIFREEYDIIKELIVNEFNLMEID